MTAVDEDAKGAGKPHSKPATKETQLSYTEKATHTPRQCLLDTRSIERLHGLPPVDNTPDPVLHTLDEVFGQGQSSVGWREPDVIVKKITHEPFDPGTSTALLTRVDPVVNKPKHTSGK